MAHKVVKIRDLQDVADRILMIFDKIADVESDRKALAIVVMEINRLAGDAVRANKGTKHK